VSVTYQPGLSVTYQPDCSAAGGIFTFVFLNDRKNWWAVIPGFTLLGIAGVILLGWALPVSGGRWGGGLFGGALAAAFWVIYASRRDQWWPIVPGGVLLTLALVAVLDEGVGVGFDTGSIFMLGLGATFLVLYLLPAGGGKQAWAVYPAVILIAIGVIVAIASSSLMRFVGPLALVAAGIYLVYRAARPKRAG